MVENMSKYQIGARPGHRAQENLFVIKSVVALFLQYNQPIILASYDVKKFFDSESLIDVMNELYRNKVRGKLYRLIYTMNKNTHIRVQTPVGLSEEAETGETVGQGTLEGAIISSVSLDNGINDFFEESEEEVCYSNLRLQPLLYQDDVVRLAPSLESLQYGNDRIVAVAESKLLDFHTDKSCFTVFGKKKDRERIIAEHQSNPVQLCGQNMNHEEMLVDKIIGYGPNELHQ